MQTNPTNPTNPPTNPSARRTSFTLRALGIAIALGLAAFWLTSAPLLSQELAISDLLFRARGTVDQESNVVIVAIDDASFAENGLQWPWPRDYVASIIDGIAAGNPKAIAIDIFYYEASNAEADAALAEAVANAGNVILVNDISTQTQAGQTIQQYNRPIPALDDAVAALGLTNFAQDADGSVRRLPAFQSLDGEFYYSWSMQAARLYLGEDDFTVISPDAVQIGQNTVELDDQYLMVNYSGAAGSIPTYSAYQVANGLIDPGVFEGKIVIFGATSTSLHDDYPTPFGSAPRMSGSEINAHAMNTILGGNYLHPVPAALRLVITLMLALAGTALALRLKPLIALAATIGVAVLYIAISVGVFGAGWIMPLLGPTAALALAYASGTSLRLLDEQRKHLRVNSLLRQIEREKKRSDTLLHVVIPIGAEMATAKDFTRLLEMIVVEGQQLCHADSASLYLRTEDDQMKYVMLRNKSLGLSMGGTTGVEIPYAPIPLYDSDSKAPNHAHPVTATVLKGATVNIADAYATNEFAGSRAFDAQIGYRSSSFLNIPMKNSEEKIIGVMQFVNAADADTGQVIPFDTGLQTLLESLSWLATVSLEAYRREQLLKREIQELRIEVDQAKKTQQVAEIVETEYFQDLAAKAKTLRRPTQQ